MTQQQHYNAQTYFGYSISESDDALCIWRGKQLLKELPKGIDLETAKSWIRDHMQGKEAAGQ